MSLVVAILAEDGAVLASDSRVANPMGFYTDDGQKLYRIGKAMALGCAGDFVLDQEIARSIVHRIANKKDAYLRSVASDIERSSQETHVRLSELPETKLEERPAYFIVVGYDEPASKAPSILRFDAATSYVPVSLPGRPHFAAIGNDVVALRLLQNCTKAGLSMESAKRLAVLCILETAGTLNNVGGPVQMLTLRGGAAEFVDSDEIAALSGRAGSTDWTKLLVD